MNIEISEEVFEWLLKRIQAGDSVESVMKLARDMMQIKNRDRSKK